MDYAIGHEDIGQDNFGAVDKDITISNRDGQTPSVPGRQRGAVRQCGAVSNGSVHDYLTVSGRTASLPSRLTVIIKNTSQLFRSQICRGRTNVLESIVVWDEHGDVFSRIDRIDQLRRLQSTYGRAQSSLLRRHRDFQRFCQHPIDDVDYTTGEVYILQSVSKS